MGALAGSSQCRKARASQASVWRALGGAAYYIYCIIIYIIIIDN